MQPGGFSYKINQDGTLGIDFWLNGQPATNSEFANATGITESQILNAYGRGGFQLGSDYPTQSLLDFYAGTGNYKPTTGGTSTPAANKFSYKGVIYDPNDANSMNQFYGIRNADYTKQLSDANNEIDRQAGLDMADTTRTYEDKLNGINKDLNLYDTNKDEYSKMLADLYEGFTQGNVARQNYFTRLSPDTFQSGEASSANYANDKYQQGYGETNQARDEWKGNLDKSKTNLGTDFNNWIENYKHYVANQKNQNFDTYNNNLDTLNTNMLSLGNKVNVKGFAPQADVVARDVNLSPYTQYTNFQGLNQSPGANFFKKFLPTNGQSALDTTLGYALPTKEKDPLNSFLYSR